MGGRKVKGSTLKPKSFNLTENKTATATGMIIDTAIIAPLNLFSSVVGLVLLI
jgi:hypothetical protein